MPYKVAVNVKERQDKLPTIRCIGYLSVTKDRKKPDSLPSLALALQQNCLNYHLLASLLSNLVSLGTMRQCVKGQGKLCFGLLEILARYLVIFKSRGFRATSLSTYDFSTLYTSLPHNLIK